MRPFTEQNQSPLIDLEGVWAGYEADTVLEDVSFKLFENDYVGLIGPNGGGKTTLIKVILGLVKPSRGRVTVMGESPEIGRQAIGYVPQIQLEDRSFPISVWDVVSMGRLKPGFVNLRMSSADRQAIEIALNQTGMAEFSKRSMNELSGGQRQRVYISRALATAPKILLLDEPTASVDPQATTQIYDLLSKLNQHLSILLISHDMTAISTYVKTIGCINRRLMYHHEKILTEEMIQAGYECPVELIAHGIPHLHLSDHHDEDSHAD
ncbi:MAG: ABC transporter ATP-binding protein [Anaerolineaceae bacterium]